MRKSGKGFTLIEILIVVIILAILAALMIPRYLNQSERGIVSEGVRMLDAIRQAEQAFFLENTAYTDTLTDLDVTIPASTTFSYAVVAASGLATATRLPASGVCSAANGYGNCTITLSAAGAWGGTHPFAPS